MNSTEKLLHVRKFQPVDGKSWVFCGRFVPKVLEQDQAKLSTCLGCLRSISSHIAQEVACHPKGSQAYLESELKGFSAAIRKVRETRERARRKNRQPLGVS